MLSVWNLQKHTQIDLQHFCSPKKVIPTVSTRYIYGNWLYACNAESGDPLAAKY